MSRHPGGIFSKASGTTAGIIFGAARTRQGKVMTSRQYVIPANPITAARTLNKARFSDALAIVRAIGMTVYASVFNRTVAELPGFQSCMSFVKRAIDSNQNFTPPPTINAGSLREVTLSAIAYNATTKTLTATMADGVLGDGDATDKLNLIVIPRLQSDRAVYPATYLQSSATRSDTSVSEVIVSGLTGDSSYVVGYWMSAGIDTEPPYSAVQWIAVNLD